ncbi:HYR domain-containing protein, partial [Flavobacteriales bacterium]|nr:HYR domain-containing protein [Flavobacteriales bacterium]
MKQLYFLALLLLNAFFANAQSVTKTSNPPGSTSIDGCGTYCVEVPNPLSFTTADFTQGCQITDVNVTVRWAKTDGTCSSPGTGNSFHSETNFRIESPLSNEVLVLPGTYTGNATMSAVTQVFDQQASVIAGGATPLSGSFRPNNGNLNNYTGTSGLGTWRLRAGDSAGSDPLCIDYYSVTIITSPDAVGPTFVTMPGDITLTASSTTCSAIHSWTTPTVSDLCGATVSQISGLTSGSAFPLGLSTVLYRATDSYGNTTD